MHRYNNQDHSILTIENILDNTDHDVWTELVFVAWLLIFGIKLPTAGALASRIAASTGRR